MLTSAPVRRAGWVTMTVLASGLALFSARYFTLDPAVFLASQAATYAAHIGPVLLHVGGGLTALAVGPWQFWRGLRTRHPAVHRAMGRIYVTAVVAAAAGGLLLAPLSLGGPMAHLGFSVLAVVLLLTTAAAFVSILRRRIDDHRAWMVRSYALIFTAVTFRAWLFLLTAFGLPFADVYAVGAWATVLIDLLAAEFLLSMLRWRRTTLPEARRVIM
jgi:uncharacterized membrane protein